MLVYHSKFFNSISFITIVILFIIQVSLSFLMIQKVLVWFCYFFYHRLLFVIFILVCFVLIYKFHDFFLGFFRIILVFSLEILTIILLPIITFLAIIFLINIIIHFLGFSILWFDLVLFSADFSFIIINFITIALNVLTHLI